MEAQQFGEPLVNFSVDLYRQLLTKKHQRENIFFSPFSIFVALSMSLAGARGTVVSSLGHLPLILSYCYDTTVESVDFKNNYEKVRGQINAWVEHVTESKIKDILPDGSVNDLTIQVLVNAIYFKGLWNSGFDADSTRPMCFHLDSKKKRIVDMMHQKNDFMIGRSDELRASALEIPYRGGKASMVVLLPDSYDGLSKLEKRLNAEKLLRLFRNLHPRSRIDLFLPKFKLAHSIKLKKTSIALGVKDLFTPAADLTGISASGKLLTSQVFHEAYVEVNEEGMEAAAATAVTRVLCCASPQFNINRPFMFVICSLDPEAILFMGSIRDLGKK
ncbi:serpin B3-like [Dermacentor silvarum]|uniref:serpin B3-like n=1 Tax=Dermacentor silvarum TaxID=543639 RepID=UPI0021018D9C|nr:serpin B3-like [Dermacentor silvarum]